MIEEIGKQALRVFNRADSVQGVVELEETGSRDNAEHVCVGVGFA